MDEEHNLREVTSFPATAARLRFRIVLLAAVFVVAGVLVWQGITAKGNPNPETPHISPAAATLDIGVLVFREGLECILVLSAITASMIGEQTVTPRPVVYGAGIAFRCDPLTWFIAIGIVNDLSQSISALNLQAATGLLAVVVLLVVMNWFFHKIYWGGWMSLHNRKKKELLENANDNGSHQKASFVGSGPAGFCLALP